MKKLVIALVCVGLLVALTIPTIYSASKWGTYMLTLSEDSEDVRTVLEQCKASKRCISSGYISDLRLWLSDKFGEYSGDYDAEGIVLSENKEGEITMQFFFFLDSDKHKKKVVLEVEGGCVSKEGWLSSIFTIEFVEDYAEITSAKGKRISYWDGDVNFTIECNKE